MLDNIYIFQKKLTKQKILASLITLCSFSHPNAKTIYYNTQTLSGIVIQAGEIVTIDNSATIENSTFEKEDGKSILKNFNEATNITVKRGNSYYVGDGTGVNSGSDTGSTIYGEQFIQLTGSVAYDNKVEDGGVQEVQLYGTTHRTQINNGGQQSVKYGAIAYDTKVGNGGLQTISGVDQKQALTATAKSYSTTIASGGRQVIDANAQAYSTTIAAGGQQEITGTGRSYGTTVNGVQIVLRDSQDPAKAFNSTIDGQNASQELGDGRGFRNGGWADTTYIKNGGVQKISGMGQSNNTTIDGIGSAQRIHNGTAINTTLTNGGIQYIGGPITFSSRPTVLYGTGASYSTTIGAKSAQILTGMGTSSLSTASFTWVYAGGTQTVGQYSEAHFTQINNGGSQVIHAGGIAHNTTITTGGIQEVRTGGLSQHATIQAGGKQFIASTGTAIDTEVGASATQIVGIGGIAKNTKVLSGGYQQIDGQATNINIETGGLTVINSGGEFDGTIANHGEFIVNIDNSKIYLGTISGAGIFEKKGAGTLIINSTNPNFTGTTKITSGVFKLGDMANPAANWGGAINVGPQGTLRGHGSALGNVTNQGVVMPGGSIGALTIGGNYIQKNNGALVIEMTPTQHAKLLIDGRAELDGKLSVIYAPGSYRVGTHQLITATNGISGTFATSGYELPTGYQSNFDQTMVYDSQHAGIFLSKKTEKGPEVVAGNIHPNAISKNDVVTVFPRNTGIYSNLSTLSLLQLQKFNSFMMQRQDIHVHRGEDLWAHMIGSQTKYGHLKESMKGIAIGVDRLWGQTALGTALAYSDAHISDKNGGSAISEKIQFAVYAHRKLGWFRYSTALGYINGLTNNQRNIDSIGIASKKYRERGYVFDLMADYPWQINSLGVTPYIGIKRAYFKGNSFTEDGVKAEHVLAVKSDGFSSSQFQIGTLFNKKLGQAENGGLWSLRLTFGKELLPIQRSILVSAHDGTMFRVTGDVLPRKTLSIDNQFEFYPSKSIGISLGGKWTVGTGSFSQKSFTAKVKYSFR